MPIRAQCPNPACRKVMMVPDNFAGQRSRCTACQTVFVVPAAGGAPAPAPGRARPQPQPMPEEVLDEVELLDEGPETEPVSPRKKKKKKGLLGDLDGQSLLLMGVCLYALFFLAHTARLPWLTEYVSAKVKIKDKSERESDMRGMPGWIRTEGKTFFGVGMAAAVLGGVAIGIRCFVKIDRNLSDNLLAGTVAPAIAWADAALLWLIAKVWEGFRIMIKMADETKKQKEALEKFGGGRVDADFTHTIFPGSGVWLGLIAAGVVAGLLSLLVARRGKGIWTLPAHGAGFIAGLIVFIALSPWDTDPGDLIKGTKVIARDLASMTLRG